MRGNPLVEIFAVILVLGFAGAVIAWSGTEGRRELVEVPVGTEVEVSEADAVMLWIEVRFSEEVANLKIEQEVDGRWREVYQRQPESFEFAELELVGKGPLKFSVEWPEGVDESVMELSYGITGGEAVKVNLWGAGMHQELVDWADKVELEK